jgi:hypothetical protein
LILRKAILIACGVAALAAAAAVCVVALAFALYAALLPAWGPALAAAGVAGACVLLILLGALSAFVAANPPKLKSKAGSEDLVAKAFVLAREKPIVAAAAILVAGAVALRNPKITATLVAAFMARPPAKK